MFSVFTKKIPAFIRLQQVSRYAKFVRKSKEELREELENSRFKIVKDSITSALKQKTCLSVPEWKALTTQLKGETVLATNTSHIDRLVFAVLLSLRSPCDSMKNARNFIEACNLNYNLNVKRTIVELYAKKQAEDKLSGDEEKELIELLVLKNSLLKFNLNRCFITRILFSIHLLSDSDAMSS